VWGAVRGTSAEKRALIAGYKAELTPERLREADLPRGRALFDRACAPCHRLYDAGGDVGPDITGSNRHNLDYLLENILDPSAQVGREHLLQAVRTRDGRLISGIIRERTERGLVVQTPNERLALGRSEIRDITPLAVSMMPEGALEQLTREEVRDLIAYLSSQAQVPLPDLRPGGPGDGRPR
ncbi:MAG: PVC-type heme-binding CxxCH protein, partial [Thermoanaerobaculia bacterium]